MHSLSNPALSCAGRESSACVSRKWNPKLPHISGSDWYYCAHSTGIIIQRPPDLCASCCIDVWKTSSLSVLIAAFVHLCWFRVRVFDLRAGSSVASLYAHHLGVTSVQADDWKIVSGGGEGLVCVWEMRMGAKLWEMHNRWASSFLRVPERIKKNTWRETLKQDLFL